MPADEVIKGVNGFTEQPIERVRRLGEVMKTIRRWEGPQALADAFMVGVHNAQGGSFPSVPPVSLRLKKGVPATIEAEYVGDGDQTIVDMPDQDSLSQEEAVWEQVPADLEKPIETHGFYNLSGFTPAILETINTAIRKGVAGATNWDSLFGNFNFNSFRNHKLRGMDTYIPQSYIVRQTITTTSLSFILQPAVPAGKIITYAQIFIPISAHFQQPKTHQYLQTGQWDDVLVNEWMVKAPSVTWSRSKRLWTLQREWWGAEKWSGALYHGGSYVP